MKGRRWLWLLLPLAAVGLDWASKAWILAHVPTGGRLVIISGFFNLVKGYNSGFIFGSLGWAPAWFRACLSVVAGLAALGYFGWEFLKNGTPGIQRVGLGLILGGALGNGLDRLQHGAVVDFLDFIFWGWPYWTFNLADSFILCGAVLLGFSLLRDPRRRDGSGRRA
jgi:signal peptidase II